MQRNVGILEDGTRTCFGTQELGSWGPREGAVMPAEEIPEKGMDEDCDDHDGPLIPGQGGARAACRAQHQVPAEWSTRCQPNGRRTYPTYLTHVFGRAPAVWPNPD
jgi:hypothetical protein